MSFDIEGPEDGRKTDRRGFLRKTGAGVLSLGALGLGGVMSRAEAQESPKPAKG